MKVTSKYRVPVFLLAATLVLAPRVSLGLLIDFESFSSGDNPSGGGVTFTNATVITAGLTLNEIELPPHSGVNVAFDDGGPMIITFSTPFDKVSGFFTYTTQLTLMAFDGMDATGSQVGSSVMSAFAENFTSSGNSPNEMLMVAGSGIRSLEILGDPGGTSFVLDDLTAINQAAVPEPATVVLLGSGLAGLFGNRLRKSRKPSV